MRKPFGAFDDGQLNDFIFSQLEKADKQMRLVENHLAGSTDGKTTEAQCRWGLGALRAANLHVSQADGAYSALDPAEAGRKYGHAFNTAYSALNQRIKAVEGLPRDYMRACVAPVLKMREAARTKASKAKPEAKAPKRLQTQKTDWLAPPTVPGEPEPFPTDVEEAIEAIQEAEAEGPRITITPARDEDGPDVAARAKLIPGEGTWAEGKKRSRKARAARKVPDELPPLTPEALAPPRKRGPRGNTRTLEYTSKSGKVCRIKISSTPNGCLLVED